MAAALVEPNGEEHRLAHWWLEQPHMVLEGGSDEDGPLAWHYTGRSGGQGQLAGLQAAGHPSAHHHQPSLPASVTALPAPPKGQGSS